MQKKMKIEVERTGGFAGIRKLVTLDTDSLPKNVARIIEGQFSIPIHLKRMSKTATRKTSRADYYCYRISDVTEKKRQVFEVTEFDIDRELKSAVNYIFKRYQNSL